MPSMTEARVPAVYMRGGTSRALIFHQRDLPPASPEDGYAAWQPIFLKAIGSPDPYGRQLNGIGGGITSLSKVAVVGPPTMPATDVDYTFGQVGVREPTISYRGNCGNISSAIGPFAVDEELVLIRGSQAQVRIHNTNTGKVIIAEFPVSNGRTIEDGDFEIQGIAGKGAPIKLTFVDPAGAATGQLLPTGRARDLLDNGTGQPVEVSLIDAANPVCFLSANAYPQNVLAAETLRELVDVRLSAAVAMGLANDWEDARQRLKNLPLVALVAPPADGRCDVAVRVISADQPHKALPLTAAICIAAAAAVPNSLVHSIARGLPTGGDLRIGHPGGILSASANVSVSGSGIRIESVSAYRTARRIMEGKICL